MTHAQMQLADRTDGTGLDAGALYRTALTAAYANPNRDVAVRLVRMPQEHIARMSSGEDLWAICRAGRVVTIMLRRSGQNPTAAALRVDRIVSAK